MPKITTCEKCGDAHWEDRPCAKCSPPVPGSASFIATRSATANLTLPELAIKWHKLQTEGEALWAEQKRGNKTKARYAWHQAALVAKRIAERVYEQNYE